MTPLAREWGPVTGLAGDVFENWNRAAPHPLDWLIAAGFVGSLFVDWRLAAASIAVLLGVILLGPIAPFVRSWLFVLPLYLIQASAGLAWATRRFGAVAPAVAAVGSPSRSSAPAYEAPTSRPSPTTTSSRC